MTARGVDMARGLVAAFAALIATVFSGGAHATLIDATHSAVFSYDESASPAAGPFVSIDYELFISHADPFDPGEVLQITTFDAFGVQNSTDSLPNPIASQVFAIATGNTLAVPITAKTGFIEIAATTGSIDLDHLTIDLHFIDPSSGFTANVLGVLATLPTPASVPEPATLALFAAGLAALVFLGARRPGRGASAVRA